MMGQELPFFSIVIPTYARLQPLVTCLRALSHLDYPHACFEAVVVDDGSKVPPDEIVASFDSRIDITLLPQKHAGPAAARNAGARQARGEFLAFTDDDCEPRADWLRTLASHFAKAPDCAIVGQVVNAYPQCPYATATQLLTDYLYAHYNADPNQPGLLMGNNLAVPARAFHAIGGFNETFVHAGGEDLEFCDRWLRSGRGIKYASDAVVDHARRLSFRTFCQQHLNYGRGAFRLRNDRARREKDRVRVEPAEFYLRLLGYPFTRARGWRGLKLTALLVVSQAAHAAGFLWESMDHRAGAESSVEKATGN
jgi:GT2 family glycosyltransferase